MVTAVKQNAAPTLVQVSKGRLSPLVAFLLQLFFGETKKSFNIGYTLNLIVISVSRFATLC